MHDDCGVTRFEGERRAIVCRERTKPQQNEGNVNSNNMTAQSHEPGTVAGGKRPDRLSLVLARYWYGASTHTAEVHRMVGPTARSLISMNLRWHIVAQTPITSFVSIARTPLLP